MSEKLLGEFNKEVEEQKKIEDELRNIEEKKAKGGTTDLFPRHTLALVIVLFNPVGAAAVHHLKGANAAICVPLPLGCVVAVGSGAPQKRRKGALCCPWSRRSPPLPLNSMPLAET